MTPHVSPSITESGQNKAAVCEEEATAGHYTYEIAQIATDFAVILLNAAYSA